MIIAVLGTACVSLGSLCGIWDFIRGLNFSSEVGLRSGKHGLHVLAVVKLRVWNPRASASALATSVRVHLWDGHERGEDKEKRRKRHPGTPTGGDCGRPQLPTPVRSSDQTQPLGVLLPNSTRGEAAICPAAD